MTFVVVGTEDPTFQRRYTCGSLSNIQIKHVQQAFYHDAKNIFFLSLNNVVYYQGFITIRGSDATLSQRHKQIEQVDYQFI